MTVSIDGPTQESYARYRINGRLDRVLANVDRINEHKRSLNSEFPHLTWQYIVFGHNAHEIEAARTLAQERDMKFQAIRNLDANYSPLQDPALAERRTGIRYAIDTDEVLDELADGLGFCHQVWDAPQVNWNGDLLGCCFNYKRAFGNALKTPLPRLLDGKDYRYLKQMLTGRAPMRHDMPCADCRFYPRRLQ